MFDVGVYAIAFITALLGPVERVVTAAHTCAPQGEGGGGECRGKGLDVMAEVNHEVGGTIGVVGEDSVGESKVRDSKVDLYSSTLVLRSGCMVSLSTSFSVSCSALPTARRRSLVVFGDYGSLRCAVNPETRNPKP